MILYFVPFSHSCVMRSSFPRSSSSSIFLIAVLKMIFFLLFTFFQCTSTRSTVYQCVSIVLASRPLTTAAAASSLLMMRYVCIIKNIALTMEWDGNYNIRNYIYIYSVTDTRNFVPFRLSFPSAWRNPSSLLLLVHITIQIFHFPIYLLFVCMSICIYFVLC